MMSELLRFSVIASPIPEKPFSVIPPEKLRHSGEARKTAIFSSPLGLLHNYFANNCGEARKTCFSASPYRGTSLLEKVRLHKASAPFGGLAA